LIGEAETISKNIYQDGRGWRWISIATAVEIKRITVGTAIEIRAKIGWTGADRLAELEVGARATVTLRTIGRTTAVNGIFSANPSTTREMINCSRITTAPRVTASSTGDPNS